MDSMDCFCAPSLVLGHDDDENEIRANDDDHHHPSPDVVSTIQAINNLSNSSSHGSQNSSISFPKAGDASPSAICQRRKLSTVIAKSSKSRHPSFAGRQAILLSNSDTDDTSSPTLLQSLFLAKKSGSFRSSLAEEKKESEEGGNAAKTKRRFHRADSAPRLDDQPSKLFRNEPHPLRLDAWAEPAAETFPVRGLYYMKDGRKVPSERSAFRLLTVDIVNTDKPIYEGLCSNPNERMQRSLRREREGGVSELPPFIFAVNLCIPGDVIYHQVSYFGINDMEEIEQGTTPFGRLMKQFIFGESDEFRNDTFKLIPRIVEGNYIVRKAVGSKPSILGKKIKQYYVRGDRYFEIIVDIASDPIAQRIVKLALGFAKSLTTDIMYVLEGNDEETLPERIFGGVRLKGIDFESQDGKRTVIKK